MSGFSMADSRTHDARAAPAAGIHALPAALAADFGMDAQVLARAQPQRQDLGASSPQLHPTTRMQHPTVFQGHVGSTRCILGGIAASMKQMPRSAVRPGYKGAEMSGLCEACDEGSAVCRQGAGRTSFSWYAWSSFSSRSTFSISCTVRVQ